MFQSKQSRRIKNLEVRTSVLQAVLSVVTSVVAVQTVTMISGILLIRKAESVAAAEAAAEAAVSAAGTVV